VVCMHPGAGNEMKQWPAEHFVALIDLLVPEFGVNVLLIGGAEETEISRQIIADVHQRAAVHSAVGEVPLSGLARLLAECALFVGNDSGPKHIAAAVGTPTIGIHSGTVDPTEWAPVGPSAVAVARKMTCSPCYLNRLADCPRELACIRQLDPGAVFSVCRRLLMREPRLPRFAGSAIRHHPTRHSPG
ncbi:MAG: glycosyltransferase family 9 protein, partial [Acetobacteraceae bacterium]